MTPPLLQHGPRIVDRNRVLFGVWAPKARALKLRLEGTDRQMRRTADGHHWIQLEARPDSRYSLVLEDGRVRPDPASRRQPDGVHGPSQLFDPCAHEWTDGEWIGRKLRELIFYELHVGTFTEAGTLAAAADRLPDLAELGITCVELMPVQPFPGARNWGYDGVAPFAVHEAYGGPRALQQFVNRAHALGLAVCLDIVLNHLGPEGNYLGELAPYFTDRHASPWGAGVNFDGEHSAPVRRYVTEACLQWVRDFHLDALRLDAVHALIDRGPQHVVSELTDAVKTYGHEVGRQIHVIGESDLNDRRLVERTPGWGLDSVWADDLHHSLHALLTGERQQFFADFDGPEHLARALGEGFAFQGQHSAFRGRPHGTSTRGLSPSSFVTCAQNHDQVGNRATGERLASLLPFDALYPVAATVLLGSGLPLLFMGEEYGETRPFQFFTSYSDPAVCRGVSEGRRREFIARGAPEVPDPQDLATFERSKLSHRRDGRHGELRKWFQHLIAIRRKYLDEISADWPRIERTGSVFRLMRRRLEVSLNLSPENQGGLKPWAVRIDEKQ